MKTPYRSFRHPPRTSNQWSMSTRGVPVQTPWPPPRYQKHSPRQRCFHITSSSTTFPALPACTSAKTTNLSFWRQIRTTASRALRRPIWSCPARAQCTWTCGIARIPDLLIQWVACPPASFHLTRMVTCTLRTAYRKLPTHHAKWARPTHHAQGTSRVSATPPPCPQPAWSGWPAATQIRSWHRSWTCMDQRTGRLEWSTERHEYRQIFPVRRCSI